MTDSFKKAFAVISVFIFTISQNAFLCPTAIAQTGPVIIENNRLQPSVPADVSSSTSTSVSTSTSTVPSGSLAAIQGSPLSISTQTSSNTSTATNTSTAIQASQDSARAVKDLFLRMRPFSATAYLSPYQFVTGNQDKNSLYVSVNERGKATVIWSRTGTGLLTAYGTYNAHTNQIVINWPFGMSSDVRMITLNFVTVSGKNVVSEFSILTYKTTTQERRLESYAFNQEGLVISNKELTQFGRSNVTVFSQSHANQITYIQINGKSVPSVITYTGETRYRNGRVLTAGSTTLFQYDAMGKKTYQLEVSYKDHAPKSSYTMTVLETNLQTNNVQTFEYPAQQTFRTNLMLNGKLYQVQIAANGKITLKDITPVVVATYQIAIGTGTSVKLYDNGSYELTYGNKVYQSDAQGNVTLTDGTKLRFQKNRTVCEFVTLTTENKVKDHIHLEWVSGNQYRVYEVIHGDSQGLATGVEVFHHADHWITVLGAYPVTGGGNPIPFHFYNFYDLNQDLGALVSIAGGAVSVGTNVQPFAWITEIGGKLSSITVQGNQMLVIGTSDLTVALLERLTPRTLEAVRLVLQNDKLVKLAQQIVVDGKTLTVASVTDGKIHFVATGGGNYDSATDAYGNVTVKIGDKTYTVTIDDQGIVTLTLQPIVVAQYQIAIGQGLAIKTYSDGSYELTYNGTTYQSDAYGIVTLSDGTRLKFTDSQTDTKELSVLYSSTTTNVIRFQKDAASSKYLVTEIVYGDYSASSGGVASVVFNHALKKIVTTGAYPPAPGNVAKPFRFDTFYNLDQDLGALIYIRSGRPGVDSVVNGTNIAFADFFELNGQLSSIRVQGNQMLVIGTSDLTVALLERLTPRTLEAVRLVLQNDKLVKLSQQVNGGNVTLNVASVTDGKIHFVSTTGNNYDTATDDSGNVTVKIGDKTYTVAIDNQGIVTLTLQPPPVPAGWTRAASNSNYAYEIQHTRGGGYFLYALIVKNLRTGVDTQVYSNIDFITEISPVADVSSDGTTVVYSYRTTQDYGPYKKGEATIIRLINDPLSGLMIDGFLQKEVVNSDQTVTLTIVKDNILRQVTVDLKTLQIVPPQGWTRAASNPNFAFKIEAVSGGGYSYVRYLKLMDLKTGTTQTIADEVPFHQFFGSIYDVSPDGSTVICEKGLTTLSGYPATKKIILQRIADPTKKLEISSGLSSIQFLSGNVALLNDSTKVDLTTLQVIYDVPAGWTRAASNANYAYRITTTGSQSTLAWKNLATGLSSNISGTAVFSPVVDIVQSGTASDDVTVIFGMTLPGQSPKTYFQRSVLNETLILEGELKGIAFEQSGKVAVVTVLQNGVSKTIRVDLATLVSTTPPAGVAVGTVYSERDLATLLSKYAPSGFQITDLPEALRNPAHVGFSILYSTDGKMAIAAAGNVTTQYPIGSFVAYFRLGQPTIHYSFFDGLGELRFSDKQELIVGHWYGGRNAILDSMNAQGQIERWLPQEELIPVILAGGTKPAMSLTARKWEYESGYVLNLTLPDSGTYIVEYSLDSTTWTELKRYDVVTYANSYLAGVLYDPAGTAARSYRIRKITAASNLTGQFLFAGVTPETLSQQGLMTETVDLVNSKITVSVNSATVKATMVYNLVSDASGIRVGSMRSLTIEKGEVSLVSDLIISETLVIMPQGTLMTNGYSITVGCSTSLYGSVVGSSFIFSGNDLLRSDLSTVISGNTIGGGTIIVSGNNPNGGVLEATDEIAIPI